jgi:arylsulfatase A
MIEAVDQNVGRLLAHLERQQLADNTLVVFTSDNGGTPQYVAPLNGSKGALYEGGIRVPCAVWGSRVENPGRTCDEPVLSMDFYPTLAELSGANQPGEQQIDGVSLLPILRQSGTLNRETVYWHFPCYIGRGEPCSAVRAGDWKLIQKFEDQSVELFNLHDDPGESRNLAQSNPDRTHQMLSLLTDWQTSLNAPRPSELNPAFDPKTVRRGQRKTRSGKSNKRRTAD